MDLDYIIDCLLEKSVGEGKFPRQNSVTYCRTGLELTFGKNYFTALKQNKIIEEKQRYTFEDILKILNFQGDYIPLSIINNYFNINYKLKLTKANHAFDQWSRDNTDSVKCLDFKDGSTRYVYLIKKTAIKSFLEDLFSRGIVDAKLSLPEKFTSVQEISDDAKIVDNRLLYFLFKGETKNIPIVKKPKNKFLISKYNVEEFVSKNCKSKMMMAAISRYTNMVIDSEGKPTNNNGSYYSYYVFLLIASTIQDPIHYVEQ